MQLFYGEAMHVLPVHIRSRFIAEIDGMNGDGNTALMLAVIHNRGKYVQLLLSYGANQHVKGQFNKPVLLFALSRSFLSGARMLEERGAKL